MSLRRMGRGEGTGRFFSTTNPYPIVEVALAIRLQAHAEKIEEDT